jgi:hypothetical protein
MVTPGMTRVRDELPTAIDDPPELAFVRDDVKGFKRKPAGAQRLELAMLHEWGRGFY